MYEVEGEDCFMDVFLFVWRSARGGTRLGSKTHFCGCSWLLQEALGLTIPCFLCLLQLWVL